MERCDASHLAYFLAVTGIVPEPEGARRAVRSWALLSICEVKRCTSVSPVTIGFKAVMVPGILDLPTQDPARAPCGLIFVSMSRISSTLISKTTWALLLCGCSSMTAMGNTDQTILRVNSGAATVESGCSSVPLAVSDANLSRSRMWNMSRLTCARGLALGRMRRSLMQWPSSGRRRSDTVL
jgi:hypothetical protein